MATAAVQASQQTEVNQDQMIGMFHEARRRNRPLVLFCADRTKHRPEERAAIEEKVYDLLKGEESHPRFTLMLGEPIRRDGDELLVSSSRDGDDIQVKFFSPPATIPIS